MGIYITGWVAVKILPPEHPNWGHRLDWHGEGEGEGIIHDTLSSTPEACREILLGLGLPLNDYLIRRTDCQVKGRRGR